VASAPKPPSYLSVPEPFFVTWLKSLCAGRTALDPVILFDNNPTAILVCGFVV